MTEMGAQAGRKRTAQERRLLGGPVDGKGAATVVVGLILSLMSLPIFFICFFALLYTSLTIFEVVVFSAILSGIPLAAGVLLVRASLGAERRSRTSNSD